MGQESCWGFDNIYIRNVSHWSVIHLFSTRKCPIVTFAKYKNVLHEIYICQARNVNKSWCVILTCFPYRSFVHYWHVSTCQRRQHSIAMEECRSLIRHWLVFHMAGHSVSCYGSVSLANDILHKHQWDKKIRMRISALPTYQHHHPVSVWEASLCHFPMTFHASQGSQWS